MKKTTKGALAAGAAAILLLGGGAGTIAFWTDSASVEGGSITHGSLALEPGTCDTTWVHADAGATPGYTGQPAEGATVTTVVPGDVIEKSCTFTVEAVGDHLQATVSAPDTITWDDATEGTSFEATVGASYELTPVSGTARTIAEGGDITSADNGATLTATFLVDIGYGTAGADLTDPTDGMNDNDTQDLVSTLDTLTVTLTQDDH